jgi:hypothetical protein
MRTVTFPTILWALYSCLLLLSLEAKLLQISEFANVVHSMLTNMLLPLCFEPNVACLNPQLVTSLSCKMPS